MEQELLELINVTCDYKKIMPLILKHFGLDVRGGWTKQLVHIEADDLETANAGQHRKIIFTKSRNDGDAKDLAFCKQPILGDYKPYWRFFGEMKLRGAGKNFVSVTVDHREFLLYRTPI